MTKKILIMGLPGSGKTTIAEALANRIGAVHFNADEIRRHIHKDLGFSIQDRVEHARRLGIMCDIVTRAGHYSIADFVCPTQETRDAFHADFVIWADRKTKRNSLFEDTTTLWQPPTKYDFRCDSSHTSALWAKYIHLFLDKVDNPYHS